MVEFKVGDKIQFYVGRRYGGHTAHTAVTKVNRKGIRVVETEQSYKPGTEWAISIDWLLHSFVPKGMASPGYNERLYEAGHTSRITTF